MGESISTIQSAIQAVLKGRPIAIQKGNKHQLGLFFLLEACQRNAAGWSTAVWQANAKLPLPHRRSSITRPCCSIERSSAKLLVFTMYMHFEVRALDRLRVRTRRRVGSTRRRGNHMHDHSRFQRDINDVTGVSLSLPLTKVTDAQYRKRFRASYNSWVVVCHAGVSSIEEPIYRKKILCTCGACVWEEQLEWLAAAASWGGTCVLEQTFAEWFRTAV